MNTELKPIEGVYNCHYDDLSDASLLLDHPKNPHIHPDRQIDALSHVIDLVGWRHPVVVSKDSGCIVYGHGRKLVAIKRGELVPVEYQSFGSEAEELAALMADNLIPELAEYSEELKLSNLEELQELDFDFEPLEETELKELDFDSDKQSIEVKDSDDGYHTIVMTISCSIENLKDIIELKDNINFEAEVSIVGKD
jgi:hypothetical protein